MKIIHTFWYNLNIIFVLFVMELTDTKVKWFRTCIKNLNSIIIRYVSINKWIIFIWLLEIVGYHPTIQTV